MWSLGRGNDDKVLQNVDHFNGKQVIVTEKVDGECTTLYADYTHARSINSCHHSSRDWVKAFHGRIAHGLPEGWRICGENMYARHSIPYNNLPSYFLGFSVWDGTFCFDWDSTLYVFDVVGITPVPVLWTGVFDELKLIQLADSLDPNTQEGYVVRVADSFAYEQFGVSVAKYVRANHVQTDEHWLTQPIVPNGLTWNEHSR